MKNTEEEYERALMASELIDILQTSIKENGDSEILFCAGCSDEEVTMTKDIGIITTPINTQLRKVMVTIFGPAEHTESLAKQIVLNKKEINDGHE